jgi:hypothetical protein
VIEKTLTPELLWPIPILSIQLHGCEELNRGLARIVFEKEREVVAMNRPTPVAGQTKGLGSHWLEYNVLNWKFPEVVEFRRHVLDGLREYIAMIGGDPDHPDYKIKGISCWANILRFGDSLEVHHHDPGFVSVHYQVQTGYPRDGEEKHPGTVGRDDMGHTVYYRPGFLDRSHGGRQAGANVSPWDSEWKRNAEPVEGKLVIFPSFVRHEVRPYMGRRERISIAMDVYIQKQESLIYFGGPRWHVPE